MNQQMVTAKAIVTAAASALAAVLGWRGILALIWVAAMALDYISGTAAACQAGEWSSATARQGLWHKGGMLLVVVAAAIGDEALTIAAANFPLEIRWPGVILPLVLTWYGLTELGSVLENAARMGASVPQWLIRMLKVGLQAVDQAGEARGDDVPLEETDIK